MRRVAEGRVCSGSRHPLDINVVFHAKRDPEQWQVFAGPGARHQLAALFACFLTGTNIDPAIAVRLPLDALIGRLDYVQRLKGTRDGLTERFSPRIQLIQGNISLFIGTVKLRESGVENKQLSALPE